MGLILDSSLFIAHEKGAFDLPAFLDTRGEAAVLAAITASEMLHGCHRAMDGERKRRRVQYVEKVLVDFNTVPFGLAEARQHARIWSALARRGRMIGSYDLVIAATALSLGYTVATWNLREFSRVPDLLVVEEQQLLPFRLQ